MKIAYVIMLANLQHFEEEESFLQSISHLIGVLIDHTPKRYYEFAFEGIEYSLGSSKNENKGKLINNLKCKKEHFWAMIRDFLSRDV